jgi:Bax protein
MYFIYNNFFRNLYKPKIIPHSKIAIKSKKELPKKILPKSNKYSKEIKSEIKKQKLVLKIKRVTPKSTKDIIPIKTQFVKPILYTKSIPFSKLTIKEKKQKFIDMIVPSILVAKQQLKFEQEKVARLILQKNISTKDEKWLEEQRKKFQALDNYELYNKMETHPTSIIIAQAIIESGWGTSRFFQKANNIFGVWSFDKKERRVPAYKKRGNKTIYLKKYRNMEASIYDYLLTLSKKDAYKEFRRERLQTKDPYKLADYLIRYSEERETYTKRIKEMIKKNKLAIYDNYELDF